MTYPIVTYAVQLRAFFFPLLFEQDGIEAELQRVIASVLSGEGFAFDVPSRAASNQLYIEALDRIALQSKASGCSSWSLAD
jgi:hypothetical protein